MREYWSPEHERAERVLGKAVHPKALDRLYELYPDVRVYVRHGVRPQFDHNEDTRTTQVWLRFSPRQGDYLFATAKQHPGDRWVRRTGIKLAFDRALAMALKRWHQDRWEQAQIDSARARGYVRSSELGGV